MDGNGRWAKRRGLARSMGHYYGGLNISSIVLAAIKTNAIRSLSLFAFSCDNFQRPIEEVNFIFKKPIEYLTEDRIIKIVESNIVIKHIGYRDRIGADFLALLDHLVDVTKDNTGMVVNLCINYSARREIETGILLNDNVDLVIRTGNRKRLSDFLLYQSAYAEIYFSSKMWPDFKGRDLNKALLFYTKQERSFGKIK